MKLICHELPNYYNEIELYPLSDLHIGDANTEVEMFEKFIELINAAPHRYLVVAGDMMNNALKTSVSNSYNETMSPSKQKKYITKVLTLVKDRILCIVPGNHEYRTTKDADNEPLEDVAIQLGLEEYYRSNGAYLKVQLGKGHNQKPITYTINVMHGSGGGKKIGAALNNLEDFAYAHDNVDIFIMGHVHKKGATRPSKIVIDTHNNQIKTRDMLCVIAPAWQQYGGYAFRGMMRPGAKGASPIILSGKHKQFNMLV